MKFSIKNVFSKCDQIHRKLRIWLHLLSYIYKASNGGFEHNFRSAFVSPFLTLKLFFLLFNIRVIFTALPDIYDGAFF